MLQRLLNIYSTVSRFNKERTGYLEAVMRSDAAVARILNIGLWLAISVSKRAAFLIKKWRQRGSLSNSSSGLMSTPWTTDASQVGWMRTKGRVLLIAELSMPQCKKYRVDQKVEAFALLGYTTTVLSWTDWSACIESVQTHSLVIFYRTPAFDGVVKILNEARRLGCSTFFDIDDLVFDIESYQNNPNVKSLPSREKSDLMLGAHYYRKMIGMVDHCIGSTPIIAEYMRNLCKGEVFVLPNCIDSELLDIGDQVGSAKKDTAWVNIGYGSGTKTHDSDFQVIENALCRILDKHACVRVFVFGHLKLGRNFDIFQNRIFRVPFLDSKDYYRSLSNWDINLAPLERSVFNDAKSNIKFLEASVFSVPSVCSDAAEFRSAIVHGQDGMLCQGEDQWYEALDSLISDANLRVRLGEAAKEKVKSGYSVNGIGKIELSRIIQRAGIIGRTNKKRILLVNILFSPDSFGGATLVTEELAKHINGFPDFEVIVFSGSFTEQLEPHQIRTYVWEGIPVVTMRLPHSVQGADSDFSSQKTGYVFREILETYLPDVVHFHSIQGMGSEMTHQCGVLNIPYIITLHDAWWLCERQFMIKSDKSFCGQKSINPSICSATCTQDSTYTHRRFYQLNSSLESAKMLLAPSEYQVDLYVASGMNKQKVRLNKNGVAAPKSLRQHRPNAPIKFAYLGGNAAHKGYQWLQAVFKGIAEEAFSLRLVDIHRTLSGPSIYENDWEICGDLEIVPPFSPQEIDEFYSDIDVLLFPSQWKESFGLTVREALIRNIWVISTDCGGPSEDIIDGVNGNLVAMSDMLAFRAAVKNLIMNPDLLRNYTNPQRSTIRTYDAQASELVDFYHELMCKAENSCELKK